MTATDIVTFFYCNATQRNATAFVASLDIIVVMVIRKFSARGIQSHALKVYVGSST